MAKYYVNDNAQPTGEHEVHTEGCIWLSHTHSVTDLGYHSGCHGAILEARKHYSNVDGCATCSPFCHTR